MLFYFKRDYLILFLLTAIFFFPINAQAFTINTISEIDFGNITASPNGDFIQIDSSSSQGVPVVITGGITSVSGGSGARLLFTPDQAGQIVDINYPVFFTITNGSDTMTINQIAINSSGDFITANASPIEFYMGGVMEVKNTQETGSYTGSMTIIINVTNP
jgi:imidazole glycerol phosphate synthase subunit HisF